MTAVSCIGCRCGDGRGVVVAGEVSESTLAMRSEYALGHAYTRSSKDELDSPLFWKRFYSLAFRVLFLMVRGQYWLRHSRMCILSYVMCAHVTFSAHGCFDSLQMQESLRPTPDSARRVCAHISSGVFVFNSQMVRAHSLVANQQATAEVETG